MGGDGWSLVGCGLGKELEEIGGLWRGLPLEKEDGFLQKEGGGEFGLSRSLSGSFSAGKKVEEEWDGCRFYQRLEWVVDFKFHRAGKLLLRAVTGEATHVLMPPKRRMGKLREGVRAEGSVADLMEEEKIEFKNRGEGCCRWSSRERKKTEGRRRRKGRKGRRRIWAGDGLG